MIRIIKSTIFTLAILAGTTGNTTTLDELNTLVNNIEEANSIDQAHKTQLECLARNIYHEARGESFEGQVAVAQVTLNRAENSNFPADICKVVHQKTTVYEKVFCQFSWYCNPAIRYRTVNMPVYNNAMEVAKKVFVEGYRLASVMDALYFHGDHMNPGWNRKRVAKIGRHVFYK
jgi:N-acetylmuramoyl-L-alanine amidase